MSADSTICKTCKKQGPCSELTENNEELAPVLSRFDEYELDEDIAACQSYGPEYAELHKYIAPRRVSIYSPLNRYGPERGYPRSESIEDNEERPSSIPNLDEDGLAEDIVACQSYGPKYAELHKYIAPRKVSIYGPLYRYGPKRGYPIEIEEETSSYEGESDRKREKRRKIEVNDGSGEEGGDDLQKNEINVKEIEIITIEN
ncbi:hypothetical protein CAEBREN_23770 [Caenorhabditis brenneri]|uniref:Uncharacterized protein n=1 Tax=Caenorhabditis brenneri TaxID=135651 RepID=G0MGU1_CAEBE|nr:hypothetical protein CAEBREN_23770 [Caenorhabditis brenneri]